jgi:Flp pilus assembly protein TadD
LIYYSRQHSEGITTLQRLLDLEPLNSQAWLLLGHFYWRYDDLVEAERAYYKALSTSVEPDVFLLIRLGQLALKRSQWENAKRLLI